MSGSQKYNDYGQQFKIEIEHALQSGDFSRLNQLVTDTVSSAVSGVTDTVSSAVSGVADQMTQNVRRGYYKANEQDSDKFYDINPDSYKETTMFREQERNSSTAKNSGAGERSKAGQESRGRRVEDTDKTRRSKYDYRTPQTAQGYRRQTTSAQDYPQRASAAAKTGRSVTGQAASQRREIALFKKNGKISGTLMQVFGGVGIGICGITSVVFLVLYALIARIPFLTIAILFFILSAGSLVLLGNGNQLKKRLEKAQRYFVLCKDAGYMNISLIAEKTGQKEKQIVRDLRKMIANGIFPQGHLDQEEKCFMLTDKTYEEYQRVASQRNRLQNEAVEEKLRQEALKEAREKEEAGLTQEQKELRRMIEEGQRYIQQIREKNDAIPGEVFSQKLYRMEDLLKEIFTNLEKMPQQMSKMQKLMRYYLPTTLKLVTAYEQFDHMSVQGEDIVNAKKEIENTIDTINDAYGELLNKLFADSAMDVTTDAQVLKTMLAKEGLVDDNLSDTGMGQNTF